MNAISAGNMPAAQVSLGQASPQSLAVPEMSPQMEEFLLALSDVQSATDSAAIDTAQSLPSESDVDVAQPFDVGVDSMEYMLSMQWSPPSVQVRQCAASSHAETVYRLDVSNNLLVRPQEQPDQAVQRSPQALDATLAHINAAVPMVQNDQQNHAVLAQRTADQPRMIEIGAELPAEQGWVEREADRSAAASQQAMPVVAEASSKTAPAAAFSVRQPPQALVQALSQRIHVQQAQGMDVATVRLDPPEMGSLEIRIRQDASGVHVQMNASHAEVGRQLATVAEGLRSELQQRVQDATVTVAHSRFGQSSDHKQREQHSEQTPEEALITQALQG